MDYNWGDPKKNSLLSSRMMAKAEVTRKKRLTSVKSTVSNQLHPAIEIKLRNHPKTGPQLASDDESSTLDFIRYGDNVSMFDKFGLNAAADGLFHPASTIEAFTEHDAKYHQEVKSVTDKFRSMARSESGYPTSTDNHRLPTLHSGKSKCERVSARPGSKLHPTSTCTSGTAPASMTTISSLSKLLDIENKRCLSANHSDSKLYAPRRMDAIPSSADRNALDFFERELESDNNNPHKSPMVKSSRVISELDNNDIPSDGNAIVPSLDISLTRKFEELKQILKSNREKHNSARQNNDQSGNEVPSNESGAGQPTSSSRRKTVHPRSSSRNGQSKTSSTIHALSSGHAKSGGDTTSKAKNTLNRQRSTPSVRAAANMNNGPSGSKRVSVNHTSEATTRRTSSSVAVAIAPPVRSKKEIKVRSGISLSDLKAEHREALQMLKELGGPVDPDYLHVHADINSKVHQVGRSTTRTKRVNHSSGSTVARAEEKSTNQLQAGLPASTPPTSANSSVSMVTKLRESISSGRISAECSPRTSSPSSPAGSSGRHENDSITLSGSTEGSDNSPHDSNQIIVRETPTTAPDTTGSEVPLHSSLSPSKTAADPWKQYDDDIIHDEDEDNNERDYDEVKSSRACPTGDRYSDEDFESDR
ncbi:Hypothetical protein PHPALM_20751 [Phytophthora palmivora]|uniref:Uncharacterized protein n=1 Tax=Phytophthora palmivora TaxID=4796 RepID=A0A2P4XE19_9STRA|nr:Hypothetical protein PHPALM_20751 [Phytophthora palmivora]